MCSQWLNTIGLLLDVAGAVLLTVGLLVSKEKAVELGVGRWAGDTLKENLTQPAVVDRLRQSRKAAIGLALLVAGFAVQIWATWVP